MSSTVPRTKRRSSALVLLEAIPPIWLGVIFLVPMLLMLVFSFGHAKFADVELGFTLDNYAAALSGFNLYIYGRTLSFAAIGTVLCLIIGVPLAYGIATKFPRSRNLLVVLLLIPFWTSFLIRTLSWRSILADSGPVNTVLNALGLQHGALDWVGGPEAVFVGIVYGYLPLMTLPLYVAFSSLPVSVNEASKDLGAGRWRTFFSVTLPQVKAGLTTGIVLTFVPMSGEYVISAILGGSRGVLTSVLITSQFLEAQNYAVGSAMAVLILLTMGVALLVLTTALRSFKK